MSLSQPRVIYGIHSASMYNRSTGKFYGMLRVLDGSSLAFQGDLVQLTGGSSKYPWAIEESLIKSEISLKVGEYPAFLFELFGGKAPVETTADVDGNVTALNNVLGSSVMKATTGIASIGLKSAASADLKFGKYVVVAASATTVDVYLSSDQDITRGTAGTMQNDLLKITATPIAITAATPADIPNFGLQLTGGSGTIAMTVGDTATFEVLPPFSKSMEVVIGAPTDSFPEFGMIMMAKKMSDGSMFEIDAYRCKGAGLPIGLEANAFSKAEIKVQAFYDSVKNGVAKIRSITPA